MASYKAASCWIIEKISLCKNARIILLDQAEASVLFVTEANFFDTCFGKTTTLIARAKFSYEHKVDREGLFF